MIIEIKRVYEPFEKKDGYRILIDRLWPRGISKENAQIDTWLKEVAPSTELRKWFNHEPEKWTAFNVKYKAELKDSIAFKELHTLVSKHRKVTLLFAAKDEAHNHAIVLQSILSK